MRASDNLLKAIKIKKEEWTKIFHPIRGGREEQSRNVHTRTHSVDGFNGAKTKTLSSGRITVLETPFTTAMVCVCIAKRAVLMGVEMLHTALHVECFAFHLMPWLNEWEGNFRKFVFVCALRRKLWVSV